LGLEAFHEYVQGYILDCSYCKMNCLLNSFGKHKNRIYRLMFPGFSGNPCRFLLSFQALPTYLATRKQSLQKKKWRLWRPVRELRGGQPRRAGTAGRRGARQRRGLRWSTFDCFLATASRQVEWFGLWSAAPWMDKYEETPLAEEPHLPVHTRILPEEVQQIWQQQQLHRSGAGWWQKRSLTGWLHELDHRWFRGVHELPRKDEGRA
jgi:hypothetical protein